MATPAATPAALADEPADEPVAEPEGFRQPFEHPALANIDKLSLVQPQTLLSQRRLTKLAIKNGLHNVVRWIPRNVSLVIHCKLYLMNFIY